MIHIFTHHVRQTEDDLREMLRDYMLANMEWVMKIGKTVLKTTTLEDNIDLVTTPGFPIDPVCILVLARMFHFHIAIFVTKGVWSTCREKSLKKCRFGLIFHGGSEYSETVKVGQAERYASFLAAHAKKGILLSHLRKKTPGAVLPPPPPPPQDEEMETEGRPKMDIPTGLAQQDMDIPTGLAQQDMDIPTGLAQQESDASSDLIVGEYVPPPPVRQRITGPQVCPCCGSLKKNQSQLIVHISTFHPSYLYPCRMCEKSFVSHNSRYKHEVET